MAMLESEYFAAVGVHAALLTDEYAPFIDRAARKIPIGIWVGTNDKLFPLTAVRATRDALSKAGFSSELTEIKDHTHWYYDRAPQINKDVWSFLQKARLTGEPKYQKYQIPRF
jgi:pimeloyl-ACP methyl ester carboxylesterase